MKPAIEGRLFDAGCVLALLGACVLVYLAVTLHWAYSFAIIGVLLLWDVITEMRLVEEAQQSADPSEAGT